MQKKSILPIGESNVKPIIPGQPNGIVPGYYKNYKDEMEKAYKEFYKVNRGDDYYDAFYKYINDQAPVTTTKTEAYEIKNTKKPDEEPIYVSAEDFESDTDLQKKIKSGSRTAKLVKDYATTERDSSMDAINGSIIRNLVQKYFPSGRDTK